MRRSKADAEQTRMTILDAAERVFCERGVATSTLEQVARAAGVTRGAFYWHFKDKNDVLEALCERHKGPQLTLIEAAATHGHNNPLELLAQTGAEYLHLFETEESKQRMHLILSCASSSSGAAACHETSSEQMFHLLMKLMVRSREAGLLSNDLTPEEAAFSLMAVMNGMMSEWLRSGRAFPLAEVGTKLLCRHMATLRRVPEPVPETEPDQM